MSSYTKHLEKVTGALLPGETVLADVSANYRDDPKRPEKMGALVITDQRVIYSGERGLTGTAHVTVNRSNITSSSVHGGLLKHLVVAHAGGQEDFTLMGKKAKEFAQQVQGILAS